MYNRYIQRSDGSFSRERVDDGLPATPSAAPQGPPHPAQQQSCGPPQKNLLSGLLPKNLDTGDLIIALLLLLIMLENDGDELQALIAVALFLFM